MSTKKKRKREGDESVCSAAPSCLIDLFAVIGTRDRRPTVLSCCPAGSADNAQALVDVSERLLLSLTLPTACGACSSFVPRLSPRTHAARYPGPRLLLLLRACAVVLRPACSGGAPRQRRRQLDATALVRVDRREGDRALLRCN